jgi:uncharacterized protein (DUF934 family)
MNMSTREKVAVAYAVAILVVTLYHWQSEIRAVLDVLEQAYG